MSEREKIAWKGLPNLPKATVEKMAAMVGLGSDATLGAIARKAREKWPDLFPETLNTQPSGNDLAVVEFMSRLDPEKTWPGGIPKEVLALRKAVDEELSEIETKEIGSSVQ